jgi:hypothetical protein
MNSTYTKALSAAIAICGFSAAAPLFAQDAPPTQGSTPPVQETMSQTTNSVDQASFAQLDANQDGAISRNEASASAELGASFDGLDADGNGSLNSSEYAKFTSMQGTSNDASGTTDDNGDDNDEDDGTPVPKSH